MRRLAAGLAVAALFAGCSSDGDEPVERGETLRPTFGPETSLATSTTTSDGSTVPGTRVAAASTSTTTTAPASGVVEASVADPEHDLTPSVEPPPPWADLLGAHLLRTASGFELRVKLAGGSAPQRTPDHEHTMNIASFYDVDGDGSIDYEIWANVASGGWGSSYFDDVHNHASFKDRSGVTVRAEGEEVVVQFPLSHLGNGSRFRWSVSSEWGRYEMIGSIGAARDYVPGDGAITFPS